VLKRRPAMLVTLCVVPSSRNAKVTVEPLETVRLLGEKAMSFRVTVFVAPAPAPAPVAAVTAGAAAAASATAAIASSLSRLGVDVGFVIAGLCGPGARMDQNRPRLARRHPSGGARRTRGGYVAQVSATFIFLMVALKVPIAGLLYIVWWAIHAEPEPVTANSDDDGGSKQPHDPRPRRPHPRPALPRPPRRGPHGAPPVPAPPRVRTVVARARARRVES
jgi:hypothetical protein